MDSSKGRYRNCLFKDSPLADIVTFCLTADCKDCTGSYTNKILGHKWICECLCHRKSEKAAVEVADSGILQRNRLSNKEGEEA
jgi:hypothetical protein